MVADCWGGEARILDLGDATLSAISSTADSPGCSRSLKASVSSRQVDGGSVYFDCKWSKAMSFCPPLVKNVRLRSFCAPTATADWVLLGPLSTPQ